MQETQERLVRITDKNRVTIPKEAFNDLKMACGDYALIRWSAGKKQIEILPVDIKPKSISS